MIKILSYAGVEEAPSCLFCKCAYTNCRMETELFLAYSSGYKDNYKSGS